MTTSLDDLPGSNVNLNITAQNVRVDNPIEELETKRNVDLQQGMQQSPPPQNQNTPAPINNDSRSINSFVTGIQEAAANGALQLPSRDIPQSQSHLTNDEQLQPNYIPDEDPRNYIEEEVKMEDMILQNMLDYYNRMRKCSIIHTLSSI